METAKKIFAWTITLLVALFIDFPIKFTLYMCVLIGNCIKVFFYPLYKPEIRQRVYRYATNYNDLIANKIHKWYN